MLNIYDLEKRWRIYKFKLILPYILMAGALFIIILISYTLYTNVPNSLEKNKKDLKEKMIPDTVTLKESHTHTPTIVQTLKPSMTFIKTIQHQSTQTQYTHQTHEKQPQIKRKKITPQVIQEVVQDISVNEKVIPAKKEPKIAITIERKETQNDIFQIIKRFQKNNNPALSLFVAKRYYELKNYEQAYNYALITNQINPDIEASWIIFAKSLIKLHKKNRAVHVLQEYINVSHSSNAEILLNEIKSGKFK